MKLQLPRQTLRIRFQKLVSRPERCVGKRAKTPWRMMGMFKHLRVIYLTIKNRSLRRLIRTCHRDLWRLFLTRHFPRNRRRGLSTFTYPAMESFNHCFWRLSCIAHMLSNVLREWGGGDMFLETGTSQLYLDRPSCQSNKPG